MRLHYRRGDRGAALAVYRQLAATLREQLDCAPDAQTEALARLIEGAGPASPLPVAEPATAHPQGQAHQRAAGPQRTGCGDLGRVAAPAPPAAA